MEQTIEIAVQVNGKVKARIKVPAAIENADAIAAAKAEPAVAEAIAGKTIAKGNLRQGQAGQHCRQRLIELPPRPATRRGAFVWLCGPFRMILRSRGGALPVSGPPTDAEPVGDGGGGAPPPPGSPDAG